MRHNHLFETWILESRMIRKDHVRFGGGTVEKYRSPMYQGRRQLATFLPNLTLQLDSRLLRANDVARILNISRPLAYRLMQTGKITTVRINRSVRVRLEDLERYVKANLIIS